MSFSRLIRWWITPGSSLYFFFVGSYSIFLFIIIIIFFFNFLARKSHPYLLRLFFFFSPWYSYAISFLSMCWLSFSSLFRCPSILIWFFSWFFFVFPPLYLLIDPFFPMMCYSCSSLCFFFLGCYSFLSYFYVFFSSLFFLAHFSHPP